MGTKSSGSATQIGSRQYYKETGAMVSDAKGKSTLPKGQAYKKGGKATTPQAFKKGGRC